MNIPTVHIPHLQTYHDLIFRTTSATMRPECTSVFHLNPNIMTTSRKTQVRTALRTGIALSRNGPVGGLNALLLQAVGKKAFYGANVNHETESYGHFIPLPELNLEQISKDFRVFAQIFNCRGDINRSSDKLYNWSILTTWYDTDSDKPLQHILRRGANKVPPRESISGFFTERCAPRNQKLIDYWINCINKNIPFKLNVTH